ncbi:UNVERIFIED_CONTAM: hypothetical protein Sangu_2667100 [Sesamum angustifolium]|uniref:Uncharacterized protein n=1 Tax=Sesamum angustifolium TaxID=2727405 RepID=A0AAW2J1M1_9LAMI
MFSKLLREEHRAATTPPNTRSSWGVSASGDNRGKRSTAIHPGSSSKIPRPSSSTAPRASSTPHIPTPSPLHPLLEDYRGGSSHSPSSPVGGVYDHLMLHYERDAVSS